MKDVYEGLAKIFIEQYKKYGEAHLPFLVDSSVSSTVFTALYKNYTPLELMTEPEKTEFKKYVMGAFPERSTEEQVKAAKIIYTISQLL